jgi:hypothetical protein
MASGERKAKLVITPNIDESLRVRILELGISPGGVASTALTAAVRRKEQELTLKALKREDPRIAMEDLKANGQRVKRLKRKASINEPSFTA